MFKKTFFLFLLIAFSGNAFSMIFEWKHDIGKKAIEKKNVDSFDHPSLSAKHLMLGQLCAEPELNAANFDVMAKLDTKQLYNINFLVQKTRLNPRVQTDRDQYNEIVKLAPEIKNCFQGKTCYIPVDFKNQAKRVIAKMTMGAGAFGAAGFVIGGVVGGYKETARNNELFQSEVKRVQVEVYSRTLNKEYPKIHSEKVFEEVIKSNCYNETMSQSMLQWFDEKNGGTHADKRVQKFGEYLGKETKLFVEEEKIHLRSDNQMQYGDQGSILNYLEHSARAVQAYCAETHNTPEIRIAAEQEAIVIAQSAAQKAIEGCVAQVPVNFSLEYAGIGAGIGLVTGGAAGATYSILVTDDLTRPSKEKEIPKMIKQV